MRIAKEAAKKYTPKKYRKWYFKGEWMNERTN
jgi:hypothetical protein